MIYNYTDAKFAEVAVANGLFEKWGESTRYDAIEYYIYRAPSSQRFSALLDAALDRGVAVAADGDSIDILKAATKGDGAE